MSEESHPLIPVAERTVDFYGDDILGVIVEDHGERRIYIPLRPICSYLGLSWSGQFERIKRDEILSELIKGVRVTRTPLAGSEQEMICIPLDFLPGWLFGISTNRVKPDLRERILRYRRECYRRLWDSFKADMLAPHEFPTPVQSMSGAELAYEWHAELMGNEESVE